MITLFVKVARRCRQLFNSRFYKPKKEARLTANGEFRLINEGGVVKFRFKQ